MIDNDTQMEGVPDADAALQAMRHTLARIRDDPATGWYSGVGTQTFSLLTEAVARLSGKTPKEVRVTFLPKAPRDPKAWTPLPWMRASEASNILERLAGKVSLAHTIVSDWPADSKVEDYVERLADDIGLPVGGVWNLLTIARDL